MDTEDDNKFYLVAIEQWIEPEDYGEDSYYEEEPEAVSDEMSMANAHAIKEISGEYSEKVDTSELVFIGKQVICFDSSVFSPPTVTLEEFIKEPDTGVWEILNDQFDWGETLNIVKSEDSERFFHLEGTSYYFKILDVIEITKEIYEVCKEKLGLSL